MRRNNLFKILFQYIEKNNYKVKDDDQYLPPSTTIYNLRNIITFASFYYRRRVLSNNTCLGSIPKQVLISTQTKFTYILQYAKYFYPYNPDLSRLSHVGVNSFGEY